MLRGGAGRIVFTPYFLCANFLVILFLTVKYWSASNYEFQLLNKVHLLEIELKTCKAGLVTCREDFKHKSEHLQRCQEDFTSLQNKFDKLSQDFKTKSLSYDQCQQNNNEKQNNLSEASHKCIQDLEECRIHEDACNSNLKINEETLHEVRSALEECNVKPSKEANKNQTLVNSEPKITIKSQVKDENKSNTNFTKPNLPDGELPDVNPSSVLVRSKPVNVSSGMKFHTDENGYPLPILPPGDPLKPRPGPRFSVLNPPKDGSDSPMFAKGKSKEIKQDTKGSITTETPNLRIIKDPSKAEKGVEDKGKEAKIKPKNLDAREAENIDYEGGDQDPNGAIEDSDKEVEKSN